MTSFKILQTNNGYTLVEPLDNIHKSMGYLMVLNPHKEVLKFFSITGRESARAYLEYVSLTRYEKIKYWIHYKKGTRGF